MQMQCEASFDKKACEELAKKIPDATSKIRSCNQDQICKGQTTSAGVSCAIGGATFAWDTLVGIVTSPYQAVQFISESLAKDKACFENQNGAKEDLIGAFDSVIPDEHSQFRISSEMKSAMLKQWSCREIQNHLLTKTKNYQAFLGPLVAQGKYNPAKHPSPLAKLVDGIRTELNVRWDCYTPAAKAEMNCYILSSALTGGAGGALALRTKLKSYGISEERIARAELVVQKRDLTIPKNPQLAVWKIRDEGNLAKAEGLEAKLIQDLQAGKVSGQTTPVGLGVNGAQFVKLDNGLEGIWKPAVVRDGNQMVSHNNGVQYEVAAYVIDQKLGLNAVPVTIEKKLNGQDGSLQLRVENVQALEGTEAVSSSKRLALFDDLISNRDRHQDNMLLTENRIVAIDHGFAFREYNRDPSFKELKSQKSFHGQVETYLDQYKKDKTPSKKDLFLKKIQDFMPQKEVYERLVNTKVDDWKKTLGPYLSTGQIRDFLKKRNQIINVVEDARAEFGDQIFQVTKNP